MDWPGIERGFPRWEDVTDPDKPQLYLNIQSVPRSKHSVSVIWTNQLILYREIMAVCSEIHTKHINTLCGQNVEFVNVKPGGTYSNHNDLKHWIVFSCWRKARTRPFVSDVYSVLSVLAMYSTSDGRPNSCRSPNPQRPPCTIDFHWPSHTF
jgi:hypothetical protein